MPHAVAMALVGGNLLPVISHLDPLAMKLIVHSHQTENTPYHQIHRCFPAALKKLRSGPFAVLISGANRLIQKLQQSCGTCLKQKGLHDLAPLGESDIKTDADCQLFSAAYIDPISGMKIKYHPGARGDRKIDLLLVRCKHSGAIQLQGVSKKIGICALSSSNPCIFAPTHPISEIFFLPES